MSTKTYDSFWEVFSTIQLVANNGGIASLDGQEAKAIVEAIEDLHVAGAAVIDIYDTWDDIQEVGGIYLEQAIKNLARIIDRTGGESR